MKKYKEIIERRLENRLKGITYHISSMLGEYEEHSIYIAGNSLNRQKPNDFDIYPTHKNQFDSLCLENYNVLMKSKNAITVRIPENGKIIQFCKYFKKDLKALVNSFDFAHIKLGAKIQIEKEDFNDFYIKDLYLSKDYICSKVSEGSFYTGSEYPLSCLMRIFKYQKRGDFAGKSYMAETIKILSDIISRGFDNYDDFKNQIDAVDLMWMPENLEDSDFEELKNLFDLLNKENKND